MKGFKDYNDFALCTMEENLKAAHICLTTPKNNVKKSCYGMSAIILLSSVIDSLGMFYRNGLSISKITENDIKNKKMGTTYQHFKAFHTKFLVGKCSQHFFIGTYYDFVRCRATHNNVLGPKINITINKSTNGKVFEKKHKRAATMVYLNELYTLVENAYMCFKKENGVDFQEKIQPTTGTTIDNRLV